MSAYCEPCPGNSAATRPRPEGPAVGRAAGAGAVASRTASGIGRPLSRTTWPTSVSWTAVTTPARYPVASTAGTSVGPAGDEALAGPSPTVGGIRPRPRTAVIFTIPAAAAAAPRWPTVPSSAPATGAEPYSSVTARRWGASVSGLPLPAISNAFTAAGASPAWRLASRTAVVAAVETVVAASIATPRITP